ncbi:MAG: ABC transporter substrate-binding protein [Thermodesulfobacteriota bacterium]
MPSPHPLRLVLWLLLACLAAALPAHAPQASAQSPAGPQAGRSPKVAMLTWRGPTDAETGFKAEMARLGYAPQYLEADAGQDPARLEANIKELAREEPDLVYTFGTTVTLAALRTFRDRPVVFSMVSNPDRTGIMQDLSGSGRNAAGATHAVAESSLLSLLLDLTQARTVGVIFNPREKNSQVAVERLRGLAERAGVRLAEQEIVPGEDIRAATEALAHHGIDAAILPSDSFVVSHGREVVALLNDHHIPTVAAVEPFVLEHGALIGLVAPYEETGREAARVADRILHGENPAAIPLAYVRPRHIVNLKTAERLGVAIPDWIIQGAAAVIR